MQDHVGYTGILVLCKHIGERDTDRLQHTLLTKEIHRALLQKIKRPDIIQSGDMVPVLVCINDSIQTGDLLPQHLLPEIGPGIDHNGGCVILNQDRRPQPVVMGIIRPARVASTSDHRHPLRRSCTKKSYSQIPPIFKLIPKIIILTRRQKKIFNS